MATNKTNSAVIWRGLSLLDNVTPIAVVVTGMAEASGNSKTGAMIQTYIVLDNGEKPAEAVRSGSDAAICGDCPHRRQADGSRSCYVNLATGLSTVGKFLVAGRYETMSPDDAGTLCAGRAVRLGTYGDPAAVPAHVWAALLRLSSSHTGYTHQWRAAGVSERLRGLVMASCDSEQDRIDARAQGWRTFRVRRASASGVEPLTAGEIVCPASSEAGKRVTCEDCGLCAGASRPAKDIAIIDHSTRALAVRKKLVVLQA
tara:strand:- start:813 stop:1586 length:774 start_codon:yes stop_codon:yes gene_type:complete